MGHKYRARPVVIDGIRFASTKEGKRYAELKLLARAGEISGLEIQPSFDFLIKGVKCFTYFADFSYYERSGQRVIEDCKGKILPLYKLKKKIIEAEYGIRILET